MTPAQLWTYGVLFGPGCTIELIFMILHLMKNMIGKHGKRGRLKFQKYHDPYLESLSIFLNHKLTHLIDLIVMD